MAIVVAVPFVLFLILAILVYLPPVQNAAVRIAADKLSQQMGMQISVGRVRLAFPLDLALHDVVAVEAGDTLADVGALRLGIPVAPLLHGEAQVRDVELYDVRLDTRSLLPDIHARGAVGSVKTNADIFLSPLGKVAVNGLYISDADVYIALSDTAQVDTTEAAMPWDICVKDIRMERSKVCVSMPGDEMRVRLGGSVLALDSAKVNTAKPEYLVYGLEGDGLDVNYATRTISQSASSAHLTASFTPSDSLVSVSEGYGGNSASFPKQIDHWDEQMPNVYGLNMNHIRCEGVSFSVAQAAYLSDGTLRVDMPWLKGREQSGLSIDEMKMKAEMKSDVIKVDDLYLKTPHTSISAEADMPLSLVEEHSTAVCALNIDAVVGPEDLCLLAAPLLDNTWKTILPSTPLIVKSRINGGRPYVKIEDTYVDWQGVVDLRLDGEVKRPLAKNRQGEIGLRAKVANAAPLLKMLPADLQKTIAVPRGSVVNGVAKVQGDNYAFTGKGEVLAGKVVLDAKVNPETSVYYVDLDANAFPVGAFLPTLGIGNFTGALSAEGHGFDPLVPTASLSANVDVKHLDLADAQIGECRAAINMAEGIGEGEFALNSDYLCGEGTLNFDLTEQIRMTLDGDFDPINLKKIAGMQDSLLLGTTLHLQAYTDAEFTDFGVNGQLVNNRFLTEKNGFTAKDVDFDFATNINNTLLKAAVGDMEMDATIASGLEDIVGVLLGLKDELVAQMKQKDFDQFKIKQALPTLDLTFDVGTDNPVSNILRLKGYAFADAHLSLSTDSLRGINGTGYLKGMKMADFGVEDIALTIGQNERGINLDVQACNKSKTYGPQFDAKAHGYLYDEDAGVELVVADGQGRKGVDLGLKALLEEGGLRAHFYPERPILAFTHFNLNDNNYLYLGQKGDIGADIQLVADDNTYLALFSTPDTLVNDLTLSINHLNVGALTSGLPFLPQMQGMLGGDVHLIDDHQSMSAMGNMKVDNLVYDGAQIGNVGMEAIYMPKEGDEHHFNAFVSAEETEVLSVEGVYYNNEEGSFEGQADMMNFPLHLLNGFLVGTDFAMKGNAGGTLSVTGTLAQPHLEGALQFGGAHLYSNVYGVDFRMDEKAVPIQGSVMRFNGYNLYSKQSDNPLRINGTLDLRQISDPQMNLSMQAQNFELINAKKTKQSLAYGKVYTDFTGTVKGGFDKMTVRGNLGVLPQTNMTYILKDSPLTVDDRLNALVKFVDFNDTTTVAPEPVKRAQFDMALGISINEAAKFHCDLSESGDNYVDVEGGGDLTLRMTEQDDMRLTGRLTVGEGTMKYTLPVIPLKKFNIQRGSYVEFTGDIMNPTLNIVATEKTKATVTENDVPRSVAFDVGVKVSRQLSNMGLEFTIDAPEDLGMQNQLAQMTTEQRGKTAVSLLATGMFLNDEMLSSGTGGLKASDALTAFLQSEIQNIAGNALRTVDLSVGMESGVSTTGTNTTDYSFQFAKRFWGNRISVIVGGRVSTGEGATNTAESFIDNVAVEYRLDKSSSRYVRAFYDRSTRDPFEGQLTKTGVGLVLRKKTNKLGELFIFRNKKEKTPVDTSLVSDTIAVLPVEEEK